MSVAQNPSDAVFASILSVLERIDERLRKLEVEANSETEIPSVHPESSPTLINSTSTGNLRSNATSQIPSTVVKRVPYTEWIVRPYKAEVEQKLQLQYHQYLGDWYNIPDDGRLRLSYSRYVLPQVPQPNFGRLVEALKAARKFDTKLRDNPGNDFVVVDFCPKNTTVLYRMREKAIGREFMLEPSGAECNAPWSRLILYQGPRSRVDFGDLEEPIPYFQVGGGTLGLWTHIDTHLQGKDRKTITNPYLDPEIGYMTTFYEILNGNYPRDEHWRRGPLYQDPLGRSFQRCSYTLYAPKPKMEDDATSCPTTTQLNMDDDASKTNPRHWTMLILCPGSFFENSNSSFPMSDTPPRERFGIGPGLGLLDKVGAEMSLIAQGLQRIAERWTDFQSYFEFLLDNGDALMRPTEHDNLLFDDSTFSRSRRYFWAIDCLSEFEASVHGTMIQWELWKKARVAPLLQKGALNDLGTLQLEAAEKQYRILQNQREFFKQKLASTKALRDALFSASAVIESRASTRTGENIKLLTFVSIFFQPLSFCTSLWSVNNVYSSLILTYVIVAVGFITYAIVLNLNNLVTSFHGFYDSQKRPLVRAMKSDSSDFWRRRGQRFDVFKPKYENVRPSEWYLPLYAMLHPWIIWPWGLWRPRRMRMWMPWRRWTARPTSIATRRAHPSLSSTTGWSMLGRRDPPPRPWREDEGWVIGG